MVEGLDAFQKHFAGFADRYVLIGGTACDLVLTEAGLPFRVTKDLDIVLCIEALDADFAQAFWSFVRQGAYSVQEKGHDRKQLYRFQKPGQRGYPAMLELFSRVPDALAVSDDSHLTPIPTDEEVSSLSAILLDEDYYGWIHHEKVEVEGLSILPAMPLIPLKAKAWLDLNLRKTDGHTVDSGTIKKHRNDVFRLFPLLTPASRPSIPSSIQQDLRQFLDAMEDANLDLRRLGVGSRAKTDVLASLRQIYGLA